MEPRRAPVDKACGEGLMPGALRAVRALVGDVDGLPLAGIAYVDARGRRAQARFRDGAGRGVRRTALHTALHEAVVSRGIEVVPQRVVPQQLTAQRLMTERLTSQRLMSQRLMSQRADGLRQDASGVSVGGWRARYVLAADGLHSAVRAELGLERPASGGPARYGLRRHHAVAPWTDLVEVHWAPGAEAYVTPVSAHEVGVAVLTTRRATYDEHLAAFPALRERLAGAAAAGEVRGAGPLRQRVWRRVAGRVLLVGDAAGYVDALTGEGLAVGLASAEAAVRCVVADRPDDYEAAWRSLTRRSRWITESLLWAARRPALRTAVVPAAVRLPRVFAAAVDQLAR
jgi:2-polyprenyl-6-methoxyphenol hydroxylase-like FAD-dependent oxidoreductase